MKLISNIIERAIVQSVNNNESQSFVTNSIIVEKFCEEQPIEIFELSFQDLKNGIVYISELKSKNLNSLIKIQNLQYPHIEEANLDCFRFGEHKLQAKFKVIFYYQNGEKEQGFIWINWNGKEFKIN